MWNKTLKQIDQEKTPKTAVKLWGGEQDSITLVSEGINLVYRFKKESQIFYLRLSHVKLQSVSELKAALYFQNHLVNQKISVCKPILSLNNKLIESIFQGKHEFLGTVCREVPGKPISFDLKDQQVYFTWGTVLAHLHKASLSFKAKEHQYTSWKESVKELKTYVHKEEGFIKKELDATSRFLQDIKQTRENYGLTHGDHRKGNVFTDLKTVSVIDFDLPRNFFFAEDIIRPFFSSIASKDTNWQDKISHYLKGYTSIKTLSKEDIMMLPWLLRLKALEIYLWTKNNWTSDIAPGGLDTKKWLKDVYEMIKDQTWMSELDETIIKI